MVTKPKFRTMYDRERHITESGDRLKKTFKISYTDTGSETLVETGVVDTFEEIQSHRDSCDLKLIIERFTQGDVNALNRAQTFFADCLGMPTSLAGFLNMRQNAEEFFMSLDPETRSQFGNDSNQFFVQIGSDRWNTVMSKFAPQPESDPLPSPAAESEVKNESQSE